MLSNHLTQQLHQVMNTLPLKQQKQNNTNIKSIYRNDWKEYFNYGKYLDRNDRNKNSSGKKEQSPKLQDSVLLGR